MTLSDDLTRRLRAANPVQTVTSFKPTLEEANGVLAVVRDLEVASASAPATGLLGDRIAPEQPKGMPLSDGSEHRDDDPSAPLFAQPAENVPSSARRWASIATKVAATVLAVAGVVVVAQRVSGDRSAAPATSTTVTSQASSPPVTVADSVPSPSVVDALGYRWSRVPPDEDVFTAHMQSVTAGGPGFVAVGSGETEDMPAYAAVWTSADGITWSRVPNDEVVFGDSIMVDVTAGGPGLVAVGGSDITRADGTDDTTAAVWTSIDGIAWSKVPDTEDVFDGASMESVTVGGPGLVAVGGSEFIRADGTDGDIATVWTSVDGIVWSRVPNQDEVFGGPRNLSMQSVTAGGPGLVAVGSGDPHDGEVAAVWTSIDGMTWSRVPHDEAVFGGAGEQTMTDVTVGGPGLVAVGWQLQSAFDADAAVWTSVDGISWSRIPHDEEIFGGPSYQAMWGVTNVDGTGVVAVGEDRSRNRGDGELAVWTSADGIAWSRGVVDEGPVGSGYPLSVTSGGVGLVAAGNEMAWVATPEN